MKTCYKCGQTKELDEFYRQEKCKDGHNTTCKDCCKAYDHERKLTAAEFQDLAVGSLKPFNAEKRGLIPCPNCGRYFDKKTGDKCPECVYGRAYAHNKVKLKIEK